MVDARLLCKLVHFNLNYKHNGLVGMVLLDELGTDIRSVSEHQKVKRTQCAQKYYHDYDNEAHVLLLALLLLHDRLIHLNIRILGVLLHRYQVVLHRIDEIFLLSPHHRSHLVHNLVDLVVLLLQLLEQGVPLLQHFLFCPQIVDHILARDDRVALMNWREVVLLLVFCEQVFIHF